MNSQQRRAPRGATRKRHCEVGWGAKIHEIDAFFMILSISVSYDGTEVGPMPEASNHIARDVPIKPPTPADNDSQNNAHVEHKIMRFGA